MDVLLHHPSEPPLSIVRTESSSSGGGSLIGLFSNVPGLLQPERFWRTVYGYLHSRVTLMRTPVSLDTYAQVLAQELDVAWSVEGPVRDAIFEQVYLPPPPSRPDEALNLVVEDAVANAKLMRLTLRRIFIDGHSPFLAAGFIGHGIVYAPDHDDFAKMYVSPGAMALEILAIGLTPQGEIHNLRRVEHMLRLDLVAGLEVAHRLPQPRDLARAIELGAKKVVRRVLSTPNREVVPILVLHVALDLRHYDLVKLMLPGMEASDIVQVLEHMGRQLYFDWQAYEVVIDSLPTDLYVEGSYHNIQDWRASWAFNDLLTMQAKIAQLNGGEVPPGYDDNTRRILLSMLAKYNFVDEINTRFVEQMTYYGLGAEAKKNRDRYAARSKEKRMAFNKMRLKEKSGRK
jgi:hypothetical protein